MRNSDGPLRDRYRDRTDYLFLEFITFPFYQLFIDFNPSPLCRRRNRDIFIADNTEVTNSIAKINLQIKPVERTGFDTLPVICIVCISFLNEDLVTNRETLLRAIFGIRRVNMSKRKPILEESVVGIFGVPRS